MQVVNGEKRVEAESFIFHEKFFKAVHVFSTDIRMEFGLKKYGILTMKRE